jgi:hypothetical protein
MEYKIDDFVSKYDLDLIFILTNIILPPNVKVFKCDINDKDAYLVPERIKQYRKTMKSSLKIAIIFRTNNDKFSCFYGAYLYDEAKNKTYSEFFYYDQRGEEPDPFIWDILNDFEIESVDQIIKNELLYDDTVKNNPNMQIDDGPYIIEMLRRLSRLFPLYVEIINNDKNPINYQKWSSPLLRACHFEYLRIYQSYYPIVYLIDAINKKNALREYKQTFMTIMNKQTVYHLYYSTYKIELIKQIIFLQKEKVEHLKEDDPVKIFNEHKAYAFSKGVCYFPPSQQKSNDKIPSYYKNDGTNTLWYLNGDIKKIENDIFYDTETGDESLTDSETGTESQNKEEKEIKNKNHDNDTSTNTASDTYSMSKKESIEIRNKYHDKKFTHDDDDDDDTSNNTASSDTYSMCKSNERHLYTTSTPQTKEQNLYLDERELFCR